MLRWSPLEEMDVLKREFENLFAPVTSVNGESKTCGFNPPVEVVEADDNYKVRLSLPGLPQDNIGEHVHLEATQKTLTVSGELQPSGKDAAEKTLISQLRYGPFFKQLAFPDGIAHENIEASYRSGILEIFLPKLYTAQKRSIQIQVK
jgi:HSP20 family protein